MIQHIDDNELESPQVSPNFPFSPDCHNDYTKIIVVIFINFINTLFALFHVHDQVIVEMGWVASDVVSEITIFCFWEYSCICEHAMLCVKIIVECKHYVYVLLDAVVIQDGRIEHSSLFDTFIPMKLNQKWEKDQQSGLICTKLKLGSHQGLLQCWVHHYCKNKNLPPGP